MSADKLFHPSHLGSRSPGTPHCVSYSKGHHTSTVLYEYRTAAPGICIIAAPALSFFSPSLHASHIVPVSCLSKTTYKNVGSQGLLPLPFLLLLELFLSFLSSSSWTSSSSPLLSHHSHPAFLFPSFPNFRVS